MAVLALGLSFFALREAWRAWQPGRLLLAGRYVEARIAAERLERSWLRIFPSVRLTSRYAIGCARHLEGDLEGSMATLAPLHRETRLRAAVCSIDAANLVLLDRDHARAADLLEEAARVVGTTPEDILLTAHAKLGAGEVDQANKLFEAAGEKRTSTNPLAGRAEDRRQQEAIFHALRGLFLVKVGRHAEAQRDLETAAKCPVSNVYVERARSSRVSAKATDAEDPRSSLAPQVVAREMKDER